MLHLHYKKRDYLVSLLHILHILRFTFKKKSFIFMKHFLFTDLSIEWCFVNIYVISDLNYIIKKLCIVLFVIISLVLFYVSHCNDIHVINFNYLNNNIVRTEIVTEAGHGRKR